MNCRKGSLTVEAAIVLPLVMMIIITLLMTTRVYYTYNHMDRALTQAAYGISSISYPLQEIGFLDWQEGVEEGSERFHGDLEIVMDKAAELNSLTDQFEGISINLKEAVAVKSNPSKNWRITLTNWSDSIAGIRNEYNQLLGVVSEIKGVAVDILEAMLDMDGAINYAFVKIKNGIAAKYVEYYVSNYFTEDYMKDVLFIKTNSLSYNDSKIFYSETVKNENNQFVTNNLITLCADYYIDIPFPVPYKDIHLKNSVTVRGLAGS